MSTGVFTGANMRSDTDAKLQSWAYHIQQGLELGLTNTGDTGQTAFNTITTSGSLNDKRGYRMYKSSDGAGLGLNDWYMKIQVGTGGSVNVPSIWPSFGWGSNGSGTLTGNTIAESQYTDNTYDSSGSPTLWETYAAAGTGWCCIGLAGQNSGAVAFGASNAASGNNAQKYIISVERTRNNDGTFRDEIFVYIAAFYTGGLSVWLNRVLPRTGTLLPPNNTGQKGWNNVTDAMAIAGSSDKNIGLLLPYGINGWMPPSTNLISLDNTSYPTNGANHTVTHYGATHTYRTVGYCNNNAINTYNRMLMRFE